MSYSFYIPTKQPIPFSEIIENFPQISFEGEQPESNDTLRNDYYYHVYEDNISVRSLEIGVDANEVFSVRIMTASSRDDYQLAFSLVEHIARLHTAKIEGEDSEPLDLNSFKAHFDKDWIDRMVKSGPTALKSMLKSGDYSGPFQLSGTRRPFYFGVDSIAKIDADDDDVFVENYFELARKVQYIDNDDAYFAATKMQMKNDDPEKVCVFSVWAPGVNYLFPDVDFVSVLSDDIIIIPIGLLDLFTKVEFIDDRQRTAERVEHDRWESVVERASALKIDPSNPPQKAQNDN